MEWMEKLLSLSFQVRDFMWGNWMVALLVITGIVLTVVTRMIQIRRLGNALKLVFLGARGKDYSKEDEGDISPFAALMTALAATVGNGNIAGVATAIATGGPGAPVWMWISGFFGMATKYAEGFLGVKFRKVAEDGTMAGGPMYYIRYGLKEGRFSKFLAALFAVCGAFAALFGTGNMAQSNSMALAFKSQFGVPPLLSGAILTIMVGLVVIGGIKRIGAVAERLVPTMIAFYFLGAITVILVNVAHILEAFEIIFASAFTGKALGGALIGTSVQKAISLGVSRGVLSNESGLGSAAIAQSASKSSDPAKNGLIAMTGTFIDTIVVNTMTTLTIVLSGMWMLTPAVGVDLNGANVNLQNLSPQVVDFASQVGYNLQNGGLSSTALTSAAFNTVLPFGIGGTIIAIASFLFGYTTLIGWAYYGEQCLEYIAGVKIKKPYRLIYISLLFIGANLQGQYLDIVWNVGDTANALMAFPNLIGLLFLAGVVAKITSDSFSGGKRIY
ncbi:amino acid carrier protein [Caldithrix abyssi DSM 13497]|uniref:Alanine or glycine:cation symporter, AGCS family n=1 Tax=Caldithrix abyssi DSM 13497 TaxID=880073 RepID=H1XQZ4_CALAY|nr:sodium:alanine symporter family protein [Caldithrix abyssi]APF20005.1 alanine or glycine:cation symporter, AGCS family [Caldithrix abyssi DSM 13497]EHO40088.1 amino acid carrier protein [Caldithrix abyssi DSM 13497]